MATERPGDPAAAIARLRAICLGLPDATERLSHGEPTWFVRDRTFVTLADHHHDDRFAFWCAAPPGAQETLVGSDPERFFRPPYVGVRGWLGVYVDVPVDWDEVAGLVSDAHRYVVETRRRRQGRTPGKAVSTVATVDPKTRG